MPTSALQIPVQAEFAEIKSRRLRKLLRRRSVPEVHRWGGFARRFSTLIASSIFTAGVFFLCSAIATDACGQESQLSKARKVGTEFQPNELATPPQRYERLLNSTKIEFRYGPQDDPRRILGYRKMAAETAYEIKYNYRTSVRWRIEGRKLKVVLNRYQLRWNVEHLVWFRNQPDFDQFWTDPLVQHEFDHVRISSDPRFENLLRRRIDAIGELTIPMDPGYSPKQLANAAVQKEITRIFDDVSELVKIRYVELDRVTRHGQFEIPADSPLAEWLRN